MHANFQLNFQHSIQSIHLRSCQRWDFFKPSLQQLKARQTNKQTNNRFLFFSSAFFILLSWPISFASFLLILGTNKFLFIFFTFYCAASVALYTEKNSSLLPNLSDSFLWTKLHHVCHWEICFSCSRIFVKFFSIRNIKFE